jgi:hypothetical protein
MCEEPMFVMSRIRKGIFPILTVGCSCAGDRGSYNENFKFLHFEDESGSIIVNIIHRCTQPKRSRVRVTVEKK